MGRRRCVFFCLIGSLGLLAAPGLRAQEPPAPPDSAAVCVPPPTDGLALSSPDDAYEPDLVTTVSTLTAFWCRTLSQPPFDRTYAPPATVMPYNADAGVDAPWCGDQQMVENNAAYCLFTNTVAWDEDLLKSLYTTHGDFAAMFVLAHEWAHGIQFQTGMHRGRYASIAVELQADCLGGAWARYISEEVQAVDGEMGLLEQGDIDEVTSSLLYARDPLGTPWLDEGAHGTFRERVRAFNDGLEGGVEACVGKQLPQRVRER